MKRFTLIELLVVIAIIGILASLLLPTLGKARKASQVTVSLSNMKQISVGITLYLDDNEGRYMPGRNPINYGWGDYVSSYIGIDLTEDEKSAADPSNRSSFKIWQCPLDDVTRLIGNLIPRSYQVNGISISGAKRIFDYNSPLYQSHLPDTSQTILINEQAKSHNTIGSGSNVITASSINITEATTGVQRSGGVQYDANHHKNGLKNPLIMADGHGKIRYMPTTTSNNHYLWSSKVH